MLLDLLATGAARVSTHRCHRYMCVRWREQGTVCGVERIGDCVWGGENRLHLHIPHGSVLQMGTWAMKPLPGMECNSMAGNLDLVHLLWLLSKFMKSI